MKKFYKKILIMLLTAVLAVSMLAGCGTKKPAPEDAQAYVQAVLDLLCTGDYDHSVQLADVEEGSETEMRDELVEELIASMDEEGLTDQTKADFAAFIIAAFEKAKYTVGDAVPSGDKGEYDVTVTIEPLKAFSYIDTDDFDKELSDKIQADYDKVVAMSEDEQKNWVMEVMIGMLTEQLENPEYEDPVDVTVHYGPINDEGAYGCSEEDGKKLGEKLFSLEGTELE